MKCQKCNSENIWKNPNGDQKCMDCQNISSGDKVDFSKGKHVKGKSGNMIWFKPDYNGTCPNCGGVNFWIRNEYEIICDDCGYDDILGGEVIVYKA